MKVVELWLRAASLAQGLGRADIIGVGHVVGLAATSARTRASWVGLSRRPIWNGRPASQPCTARGALRLRLCGISSTVRQRLRSHASCSGRILCPASIRVTKSTWCPRLCRNSSRCDTVSSSPRVIGKRRAAVEEQDFQPPRCRLEPHGPGDAVVASSGKALVAAAAGMAGARARPLKRRP